MDKINIPLAGHLNTDLLNQLHMCSVACVFPVILLKLKILVQFLQTLIGYSVFASYIGISF